MEDTVKVLNQLIETSEDGMKGFKEAADKASDPTLKTIFSDRAAACSAGITELQGVVTSLGGEPQQSGTAAGAAHRGWAKVKSAVADTNLAMLEEVERGEDHAKAVYTKALKAELPAQVRVVIEKQFAGVKANHDRVRDLRNQYKSAA